MKNPETRQHENRVKRTIEIPEVHADQIDELAERIAKLNAETLAVSREALLVSVLRRGLASIAAEVREREHAACAHPTRVWYQHPHDDPEEVFCSLCHGQVPRSVVVRERRKAAAE